MAMESFHGTAGGSVTTLTFAGDHFVITVFSRSATATDVIYYTIDGTTPTVGGANTYVVTPAMSQTIDARGVNAPVVKLISNATPGYSVIAD